MVENDTTHKVTDRAVERRASMNPLEPYKDEQLGHFEYYKLADSIPICFLVDKEGYRYGALVPGSTRGSLE